MRKVVRGELENGEEKIGISTVCTYVIVIRPLEPVYSKTIEGPLSMKVLNNDYLLKE